MKVIIIDHEGLAGQDSAQSDLHEGIHSWNKLTPQISQGCGNLVPTSPYTASGETLVRAPRAIAERASSVGICLAN